MEEVIVGVNEEGLSSLSLDTSDVADQISEIFDKIDLCMEKLPTYYQGDSCSKIMDYYNDLKSNYPIIKKNIISYSDDFTALVQKMQEHDKNFSILIQGYTEDTINKRKSITN